MSSLHSISGTDTGGPAWRLPAGYLGTASLGVLAKVGGQFLPAADVQFFVDPVDVPLHRAHGDTQTRGDFPAPDAAGCHGRDVAFPAGQLPSRGCIRPE